MGTIEVHPLKWTIVSKGAIFCTENNYITLLYQADNIFPPLGSFYPFSILAKSQTLSKFEVNFPEQTEKRIILRINKRIVGRGLKR